MDNFVFYSPTMFAFGDGEEKKTGALVKRFGGTKVLLIYGGGSIKKNGIYDAVTKILKDNGKTIVEDAGVMPNPTADKLREGVRIARENHVDLLLDAACILHEGHHLTHQNISFAVHQLIAGLSQRPGALGGHEIAFCGQYCGHAGHLDSGVVRS